jgi:hypothetical protein
VRTFREPIVEFEELNPRMGFAALGSYDYKGDVLRANEETVFHELVHFHDHVATPYGHFLDSLVGLHVEVCRGLVRLFSETSAPSMPVPLREILQNLNQVERVLDAEVGLQYDLEACTDFLVVLAISWPSLIWVERCLEGTKRNQLNQVSPERVVSGLKLVEAWEGDVPKTFRELERLMGSQETWSTPSELLPKAFRDRDDCLGAITLLEGRAIVMERGGGLLSSDAYRAGLENGTYGAAVTYFAALFPADTVNLVMDTFMLVADLALCTPIGRTYSSLRREEDWSVCHPGWRFLRLADAVREGVGLFDWRAGHGIFEYQERLCDALGWPGPRKFLDLGLHAHGTDYRTARHRMACKMKLKYPRFFIVGSPQSEQLPPDDDGFLDDWLPFWVHHTDGKLLTIPGVLGQENAIERLLTKYLYRLGWAFFVSGQVDDDLLDDDIQYERLMNWQGMPATRLGNYLRTHLWGTCKFQNGRAILQAKP